MVLNKFSIGEMRSAVVFLQNNPTGSGMDHKDSYSTLVVTRGRLRKNSGARDLFLGEIAGQDSYELICRFQNSINIGIRVNGKVTVDGQTYTIIAPWEIVDQIKHWYKFKLNIQVVS